MNKHSALKDYWVRGNLPYLPPNTLKVNASEAQDCGGVAGGGLARRLIRTIPADLTNRSWNG
jgi:hypothetical protein